MANTQAATPVDVDPPKRPEFVKVDKGEIVERGLPETGELPDGRHVSGFDKLPDAALKSLGWAPVQDPGEPNHDPETQVITQDLVVAPTGEVTAVYTVEDLPAPVVPDQPVAMFDEQVNNLFTLLVTKGVITQAEWDEARKVKPPA